MAFVVLAGATTAPLMADAAALGLELASATRVGAASALLGSIEAVLAAAVVPLLELWPDAQLGMIVVMALAGGIALVALAVGLRWSAVRS